MDKQREIYRKSIVKLFKENFQSARFEEKRDGMITACDFETIRDEIEEDYYIKNKGITPYSKAIKYLQMKIEACTAAKTLFSAIEDFIMSKENITITKITKSALANIKLEKDVAKKMKRKKESLENETDVQVHAECKSPQSCKKCRIMRRLDRSTPKIQKSKQKKKKATSKKKTLKTEHSSIECLDAPSNGTYANHLDEPVDLSKSTINEIQNDKISRYQLPYPDHQYSRISFYGSGIIDDAAKMQSKSNHCGKEGSNTKKQTAQEIGNIGSNAQQKSMPSLLHCGQQSNTLQQTTPANYIQNLSNQTTTTNCVQVQPIARPIPQRNQNLVMTSAIPMNFNAPITFWQRPIIQQPFYYIRFAEPKQ